LKLEQFTIFKPSIEMDRSFVTSLRRVDRLETVLIRTRASNGAVGWGEAPISPQVTGETPDSSLSVLRQLTPKLLGFDRRDREKIHYRMKKMKKEDIILTFLLIRTILIMDFNFRFYRKGGESFPVNLGFLLVRRINTI